MRSKEPKNITACLKSKFIYAFSEYLKDNDRVKLIKRLRDIEDFEKERGKYKDNESLWFRFFADDTGAWTVSEILNDLKGSISARAFIIQNMKIAIKENSMKIYYS